MTEARTEPDARDAAVDFVAGLHEKTGTGQRQLVGWLGLGRSKFYEWKDRYGKANEHNGRIPRGLWAEEWERDAIQRYSIQNPMEGYRRRTYMMMDENILAVSPSTTCRVLKQAGLLDRREWKPWKKGTGFIQPPRPHQEWHIDMTYINLSGTFCYLCSLLDGFSRTIVHWDMREAVKESDVDLIVQKALERFPGEKPRLISDNGPQFVARDPPRGARRGSGARL